MKISPQPIEEFKLFIESKFPDVYAAFLSGSAVDGNFNSESDYDIYIVTYTRDFVFSETFNYQGKVFQAVHLPINKIDEILWLDSYKRSGVYISAFAKGIILVDENSYLSNLIKHCKILYDNGPPEAPYHELQKKKISVINLISDLAGNTNNEEKIILSHDLFQRFINLYLDLHRCWISGNKHLIRQLKNVNQHLSTELSLEIRRFHEDLNVEGFLKLIREEMALFGSLANGYSLYPGLINVKSSYVIISFSNIQDYYHVRGILMNGISSFVVDKKARMFIFRTYPLGDMEDIGESIYLVLDSKDINYANEEILPLLRKTLEPICRGTKVGAHFPVNFDLSIFFGGDDIIKPTFALFDYVSNIYCSELNNSQSSISLALRFAKVFESVVFKDSEWEPFLTFISLSWISRAYDNKKLHSITDIVEAKDNLLTVFSKQYTLQKQALEIIFNTSEVTFRDTELGGEIKVLNDLINNHCTLNHNQAHPVSSDIVSFVNHKWLIYRNILDYVFSILMIRGNQKSYLIHVLKELSTASI